MQHWPVLTAKGTKLRIAGAGTRTEVRCSYKSCDNFVDFFHNSVCINSMHLVVPLGGQGMHKLLPGLCGLTTNSSMAFVGTQGGWNLVNIHSARAYLSSFLLFGNDPRLDSPFSNFLTFILHSRLIMTPHASYVSHLTRSYGKEKSLSYYDLFNFRVLFYGCTPTLISIFFFNNTTLILTINTLIVWADLQQDVTRTRHLEQRKILSMRRTLLGPH